MISATSQQIDKLFSLLEETIEFEANTGCWLSWRSGPAQYTQVAIGGKGPRMLGHRVSWAKHFGPIPDGLWVLHKCDTPACCNPQHLFLGSPADNTRDMMKKGRSKFPPPMFGDNSPAAKLTSDDVREIRRIYRRGVPGFGQVALAKRYGVNFKAVARIVNGTAWTAVS